MLDLALASVVAELDRLKVCWLVPGFPETTDDPNYSFLGREARELGSVDGVDLRVIVDAPWSGAQPEGFEVRAVPRPEGPINKALVIWSAFAANPTSSTRFLRNPRQSYATLWRVGAIIRSCRSWEPDVVHSHFAVPSGTCGVSIANALGAARVVSLRGVDLVVDKELEYGFRREEAYDRAFRRSLALVDFCCIATTHMRTLAIGAGAAKSSLVLLPNSVDVSSRQPDGVVPVRRPAGAKKLLLSVGHLRARKGFDRGIRAISHLPVDHHYVIIGEGIERGPLEALAAELGVADRTHLLGEASPSDVAAWMREADCYWFLSRLEAFGNVVLEAFAADATIVAAPLGVAPMLANKDRNVFLLAAPDDAASVAETTAEALRRIPDLGRAGHLECYSAEARLRTLMSVYRGTYQG
jgi:glycosyltransferase involved in cell wall biosynthesis